MTIPFAWLSSSNLRLLKQEKVTKQACPSLSKICRRMTISCNSAKLGRLVTQSLLSSDPGNKKSLPGSPIRVDSRRYHAEGTRGLRFATPLNSTLVCHARPPSTNTFTSCAAHPGNKLPGLPPESHRCMPGTQHPSGSHRTPVPVAPGWFYSKLDKSSSVS